jgi:hypothetical protein
MDNPGCFIRWRDLPEREEYILLLFIFHIKGIEDHSRSYIFREIF